MALPTDMGPAPAPQRDRTRRPPDLPRTSYPSPSAPERDQAGPKTPAVDPALIREIMGSVRDIMSFTPEFDVNAVNTARNELADAVAKPSASDQPKYVYGMPGGAPKWEPPADAVPYGQIPGPADVGGTPYGVPPANLEAERLAEIDRAAGALTVAERGQREQALHLNRPSPDKPIKERTDELTDAEYLALTPQQRAAVDFNTQLVRAVSRDTRLADKYDPTDMQQEIYDKSLTTVFGPDDPSLGKEYAPETLALLRQIGFSDEAANLDDFLGLKAAIQAKDLRSLEPQTVPTAISNSGGTTPQSDRADLMRTLADQTKTMEAALIRGNDILQSINATAINARNETYLGTGEASLGGIAAAPHVMPGYGNPGTADARTLDGYFQMSFDLMKAEDANIPEILSHMQDDLNADELKKYMAYADARTLNAETYGQAIGGKKTVDPARLRHELGLDGRRPVEANVPDNTPQPTPTPEAGNGY